MIVRMEGSPAHASRPEDGKNPSFAIARIITAIPRLISPKNGRGMVLCTVVRVDVGERAFGLSASRGELCLTIRADSDEGLGRLQQDLEELSFALAKEEGLKVGFEYADVFPATVNHAASIEKVRQVARAKGLRLIELPQGWRSSEDFGHYLKQTKGAVFFVGNGEAHPPVHTPDYDFPDEDIEIAVEIFKGLASP